MIQLNELLEILDVGVVELEVPITTRLSATVRFDPGNAAELDDATLRYGGRPVTALAVRMPGNPPVITLGKVETKRA